MVCLATVIVSDDAGQFRVGNHALCWVHAERLLQKLMPATPRQVRPVETVRHLVWRFYRALKSVKRKPTPGLAAAFHKRFARIFSLRTGYEDLDKLLARLSRRKDELLKVLERPSIPLNTKASENDLRSFVTKRKISGGTMSRDGRVARDTMLGLMKTCRKLACLSGTFSAIASASTARPFRRWLPLSRQRPKSLFPLPLPADGNSTPDVVSS